MKSAIFAAVLVVTAFTSVEAKPNLIFILSDDTGMGDLGCYGQKLIQTPNLDRMAAEGTRYLQAYSGTSVCAPSRSSLMTGLHMGHCPIRANRELKEEGQMPLPEGTVTVAQLLKEQGYATASMGKWGMGRFDSTGSPFKVGFDHFFGYNCQRHAHSYFPTYLYNNEKRFELAGNDGKKVGETYAQNLIQDDVIGWVKQQKDNPFFLFYAATLPHGKYEIDDLGEYEDKPWTTLQKTYAAMVSRLDRDVGELLATLKEMGVAENTLVIFTGDNGSSFDPESEIGEHFDQTLGGMLRGYKRGMYEGALRQAAISWWPGTVPAGRVTEEPWAFWDYLPTAVELAGAKMPAGYETDGKSLVAFLKGGDAPQRDHFYWELHEFGSGSIQAARFGEWKAVRNGPGAKVELYNLKADGAETKDLAAGHPEQVAQAEQIFETARNEDPNWPFTLKPKKKGKP